MSVLRTSESRDKATDDSMDPTSQVAWALVYVGDRLAEVGDTRSVEDGLRAIATEVGGLSISVSEASRE